MIGKRSRKFVLGVGLFALLAIGALVGLMAGQTHLALAAAIITIFAIGVLLLEAAITLRRTEREVRKIAKAVDGAARKPSQSPPLGPGRSGGPVARETDLIGTIRLLQAQYVSRLDRAQATLEAAASRLPDDHGN